MSSEMAVSCRRSAFSVLLLTFVVFPQGCGSKGTYREVKGPGSKVQLRLGGKTVEAEVAQDAASRQLGLMYRESLPPDAGMLFIHDSPEKVRYHMKNTLIPLSIAFLDDTGKILQIEDMKPKDTRFTRSKEEVRFALEMIQGWYRDNGVKVGDTIENFPEVLAELRIVPQQ